METVLLDLGVSLTPSHYQWAHDDQQTIDFASASLRCLSLYLLSGLELPVWAD